MQRTAVECGWSADETGRMSLGEICGWQEAVVAERMGRENTLAKALMGVLGGGK